MFKVGEYVVYKKDVCMVSAINKDYLRGQDYYSLISTFDKSLTIQIPVDNKLIKPLLTKEEAQRIISDIPSIEVIPTDDKFIENDYKLALKSGSYLNLIKVIKTTYLKNKKRADDNKKMGEKDNNYFHQAERQLYREFSLALGVSYEEIKKIIIEALNKKK